MPRLLFLLSPYRPPTSYPITLAAGEAASWLNAWAALWQPELLREATKPPEVASSYDHDEPTPEAIYAVPAGPTLYQPTDWAERLTNVGAISFEATACREETFANLGRRTNDDISRMFAAIGFAYLTVETWFDAASHDHLLDAEGFWNDVVAAANALDDPEAMRGHLKAAAEKLQVAREVLHSGNLRFLDCVALSDTPVSAWPDSLSAGLPLTVILPADRLERLKTEQPERFAELMAKCPPGLSASVEFAGGAISERDDVLLPVESQLHNLTRGRQRLCELTGQDVTTYARLRAASHLHLPGWLTHAGYSHAMTMPVEGDGGPPTKSPCVQWPGPDGKTIEAFAKEFLPADDGQTFFNLAYHLHHASGQEATPAFALLHRGGPASEAYRDLVAFADLGTALGEWQSVKTYLTEIGVGDYAGTAGADDYAVDVLDDRVARRHMADPVSSIAKSLRLRRRIDAAFGLAALHRSLSPATPDEDADLAKLTEIESTFEDGLGIDTPLSLVESSVAKRLAERIVARGEVGRPGYLIANPCSYPRRVALELPPYAKPIAVADPVKSAQFDTDATRFVVEVPSLGFAWIPRGGPAATPPKPRLVLAEGVTVRNEFFEAEFDPATGGLRAFRDLKTRQNRFGAVPVFQPGSKCRGTGITVTRSGAALGEIVSTGELVSEQDEPLATFRLTARAWMGRPVLEWSCDWQIAHAPTGYAWHAYYGLRFGVRDDRIACFRGVNGCSYATHSSHVTSPDFFEFRFGRERSFVFPGGVPFLNKVGPKTYDLIHVAPGETETKFDGLLALDRDNPMPTAAGWVAPVAVVPVDRGPPPTGAASWLLHLDMPSLIVTDFRPTAPSAEGMTRAVSVRLMETAGYAASAKWNFARDPQRAFTIDAMGNVLADLTLDDGAVPVEVSAGELIAVRAEWV
jgi:hypothetical protein